MKGITAKNQAEWPVCSLCQRKFPIEPRTARLLNESGANIRSELICESCALKLGLGSEVYEVYAGYLYQRFPNFWLKLWPVGTFQ